ncbi:hemoglobin/transferrin/lactoferrin receptor protein [Rhizobiales bacterium GAS113]|nr:hemoglobin/transferrin/lactoferrin receptor protein [Rhizobiales bacterium GAS113]
MSDAYARGDGEEVRGDVRQAPVKCDHGIGGLRAGGRRVGLMLTAATGIALAAIAPALAQQATSPAQAGTSPAKPVSQAKPISRAEPISQAEPLPRATAGGTVDLDAITVTATKTGQSTVDVLGGASIATRQDVERLQPSSIADLVRNMPGVSAQESQNDPGQSINIRGLQNFGRVNVLVDGARQEYQISGHNANGTFYLDPEFIGQADVVRGPIANIYGSGAIGGVVSLRSRGIDDILNPDETYGVVQRLGIGSNGAGVLNSTAGAARLGSFADVFGQLVYRNSTSYKDGDGTKVPDTGNELTGGLMKLNVQPGEGQRISATALMQDYQFKNNGTSTAGSRFKDDVTANTFTLGYSFLQPDNPWVDFNIKTYYSYTQNRQTAIAPDPTYRALGVVPGDPLSDAARTYGIDIHNTSRFSTFAIDHALTIGADGSIDRVRTSDQAGGFISALTPSGQRRLAGAFIQDEARYGGWLRVLGAVRYDEYSLTGGGNHSDGSHVSPKLTIGVTPIAGMEFYGTYAEGYRAPSITETLIAGQHPFPAFTILPNPTLRPETARDLEAGVNLKYDNVLRDGDSLRGKITLFSNRISDFIDFQSVGAAYLVPFIPGAPVSLCKTRPFLCFPIHSFQYQNVAKARIEGVEIEGAYDWGGGFVSLAGSRLDGKNRRTNAPLNTVAPGRVSSTLGLRFLDQALTLGARYTFTERSSRLVTTPSKDYATADMFASYKFDERVRGDFTVTNLFNRKYVQYLSSDPSPGVTVKFALTVKFAAK